MRGTKRRLKGNPTQIFTLFLWVDRANDFWRYFRSLSDDFSHFPRLKLVLDSSKGSFWGLSTLCSIAYLVISSVFGVQMVIFVRQNLSPISVMVHRAFWGPLFGYVNPSSDALFHEAKKFLCLFFDFSAVKYSRFGSDPCANIGGKIYLMENFRTRVLNLYFFRIFPSNPSMLFY